MNVIGNMIGRKGCAARRRLKQRAKINDYWGIGSCIGLLLLCAGLLASCGGSSPRQTAHLTSTPSSSAFQTTSKTSDGTLIVQLSVTPDRLGMNQFTVTATEASSGQPVTQASVTLFTTMLTMAMGTDSIPMQSDGKGHYTAQGLLAMSGSWQLRVVLHTADHVLHEAIVQFTTSK